MIQDIEPGKMGTLRSIEIRSVSRDDSGFMANISENRDRKAAAAPNFRTNCRYFYNFNISDQRIIALQKINFRGLDV